MGATSDDLMDLARAGAERIDMPDDRVRYPSFSDIEEQCANEYDELLNALHEDELFAPADVQRQEEIVERLKAIKAKEKGMPMGEIRALGAMCAFELVTERGGNKPDAAAAKALVAKCLERGLLILSCGVYADTIRLLAPLTASEPILKEGLDILESAILGN